METKTILIALGATVLGLVLVSSLIMTKESTKLEANGIPEEIVTKFQDWCKKFNKESILSDKTEAEHRLGVYYENYKMIMAHNAKGTETYTLGENQFMTLTNAEFRAIYLGLKAEEQKENYQMTDSGYQVRFINLTPVDWTTKGAVTPIKDQGQCGSCWAFSTTGGLEGTSAIFGSGLQSFSEQQLVDCSGAYGNQGCNGGLMDNAFKYVIAKGGITTESAYPYTAVDGTCQSWTSAFKISKFTNVKKKLLDKTCTNLQTAITQQPISIGVDAANWQFYSGGVFSNCAKQLDHGVLAVGFDAQGNWKVKNSWGTSWGENGFIQLKGGNTCGICNTASYASI